MKYVSGLYYDGFDDELTSAVDYYYKIETIPPPRTEADLRIRQIRHNQVNKLYWKNHPDRYRENNEQFERERHYKFKLPRRRIGLRGTRKERLGEFFMRNSDDILTTDRRLEMLSDEFGVDTNLPRREQQERVYDAMAKEYIGNGIWSKREVERDKKRFLEAIEKIHFVELTAETLGINTRIVNTWLRTDPDFAEGVRLAQIRLGQRVAAATFANALEGDLGAQMFVLKQFKDSIPFLDPRLSEQAQVNSELDVNRLSSAEQETLLKLMRKSKEGMISEEPRVFIEEDIEPERQYINIEPVKEVIHEEED